MTTAQDTTAYAPIDTPAADVPQLARSPGYDDVRRMPGRSPWEGDTVKLIYVHHGTTAVVWVQITSSWMGDGSEMEGRVIREPVAEAFKTPRSDQMCAYLKEHLRQCLRVRFTRANIYILGDYDAPGKFQ